MRLMNICPSKYVNIWSTHTHTHTYPCFEQPNSLKAQWQAMSPTMIHCFPMLGIGAIGLSDYWFVGILKCFPCLAIIVCEWTWHWGVELCVYYSIQQCYMYRVPYAVMSIYVWHSISETICNVPIPYAYQHSGNISTLAENISSLVEIFSPGGN